MMRGIAPFFIQHCFVDARPRRGTRRNQRGGGVEVWHHRHVHIPILDRCTLAPVLGIGEVGHCNREVEILEIEGLICSRQDGYCRSPRPDSIGRMPGPELAPHRRGSPGGRHLKLEEDCAVHFSCTSLRISISLFPCPSLLKLRSLPSRAVKHPKMEATSSPGKPETCAE